MLLYQDPNTVDSLPMETTLSRSAAELSDQELVDLYAIHAGRTPVIQMTVGQIHEASQAAYALELRGYFEQAGIWLHDDGPALFSTA
jgi:hypothetical protein